MYFSVTLLHIFHKVVVLVRYTSQNKGHDIAQLLVPWIGEAPKMQDPNLPIMQLISSNLIFL